MSENRPRLSTLGRLGRMFGSKATAPSGSSSPSTTSPTLTASADAAKKSVSPSPTPRPPRASLPHTASPRSTSQGSGSGAAQAQPLPPTVEPSGLRPVTSGGWDDASLRTSSLRVSTTPLARTTSKSEVQPQRSDSPLRTVSLSRGDASVRTSDGTRFQTHADGTHTHNLRSAKRQEKLGSMLKDLMGAKKLRDEAISAVPNLLSPRAALGQAPSTLNGNLATGGAPSLPSSGNTPPLLHPGVTLVMLVSPSATIPASGGAGGPTLFSSLVHQIKQGEETPFTPNQHSTQQPSAHSLVSTNSLDSRSFLEKYGRCQEVIGKGAFGVVRVLHKRGEGSPTGETLFAVKEFKRRGEEDEKSYSRRLTSEFCISSSLKHPNIIHTLDLLQDAKGDYCEVMEFCAGGDLYTLIIAAGRLEFSEADCFFKQLIRGVNYMHEMGVAHRDLKPENILLTSTGQVKITDFGNGECFRMAWETGVHFSLGVCGLSPYIAPEEYLVEEFDPRAVDIWACGVIYMAMRTGRQLWRLANDEDEYYATYLEKRRDTKGYDPIEGLKRARCRNVIYSILDPVPQRRITGKQILNSEWGREIKVCSDEQAA